MISSSLRSHLIIEKQQPQQYIIAQNPLHRLGSSVISANADDDGSYCCSGYSADKEDDDDSFIRWDPPITVLLLDTANNSKRYYNQNGITSTNELGRKRRKLLNDLAASKNAAATRSTARAGLPSLTTTSNTLHSRNAPPASIDPSNMRLVFSTESSRCLDLTTEECSIDQYDFLTPDLPVQSDSAYQLSVPMSYTVALPNKWKSCTDRSDGITSSILTVGTGTLSDSTLVPGEPTNSNKKRASSDSSSESWLPAQVIA